MSQDRIARLQHFIDWSAHHITGDEKGQAQIFLDRPFQAFGQPGALELHEVHSQLIELGEKFIDEHVINAFLSPIRDAIARRS